MAIDIQDFIVNSSGIFGRYFISQTSKWFISEYFKAIDFMFKISNLGSLTLEAFIKLYTAWTATFTNVANRKTSIQWCNKLVFNFVMVNL